MSEVMVFIKHSSTQTSFKIKRPLNLSGLFYKGCDP
jgi:hypothetical protein